MPLSHWGARTSFPPGPFLMKALRRRFAVHFSLRQVLTLLMDASSRDAIPWTTFSRAHLSRLS
jgi:hypothetical protein